MTSQTLWFLAIAVALIGVVFGLGIDLKDASDEPIAESGSAKAGLPFRFMSASEFSPAYDEFNRALPVTEGENLAPAATAMKSEVLEIELALDEGIEYKAVMTQGASIVYHWRVLGESGASDQVSQVHEVYYDFHGHPPDADPDFFTRYEAGEGAARQGAIIAAYDGQHGWYWLNISDSALTIELRLAGFYDEVLALSVP